MMGKEVFRYKITKDETIRIFWEGRCVMTLGGQRERRLAAELASADQGERQAVLQRATGNFRRGNERRTKRLRSAP